MLSQLLLTKTQPAKVKVISFLITTLNTKMQKSQSDFPKVTGLRH